MLKKWFQFNLAALLISALTACASTTLLELNQEFVNLTQQTEQAKSLKEVGDLDAADFESVIQGYRAAFVENGKRAEDSARKAKTAQNRSSFLNVAVRSYLKSGPLGESRIPDLAEQGIRECASKAMQGLNALPVTCGYFHVVVPQAVNNELSRKLVILIKKEEMLRGNGIQLSVNDGKALRAIIDQLLEQVDALNNAHNKIIKTDADPDFEKFVVNQQHIIFCNAEDAQLLINQTVKIGDDWNRKAVLAETKNLLSDVRQTLIKALSGNMCPDGNDGG